MAGIELRMSDAISSGSDLVQTAKVFEASKFYTEPMFTEKQIVGDRCRIRIDISKPIDLKSLILGWTFKFQKSTADNAGPNTGTFNVPVDSGANPPNKWNVQVSTHTGADDYFSARHCMSLFQFLKLTDFTAVIPCYMLKYIRMQINGANIGEIPPISIVEEMPHWLTFVSVLYNTFDRPKPLSLDTPGYFFPRNDDDGSSQQNMFHWFNTMVHDSLVRYDHDLTSTQAASQEYYVQFPLGKYIEQHFGIPVRWLTLGI